MRYDQALMHTSSVSCLETFRSIIAVTLPLVRSNSWGSQLAIPNDPRYARLETGAATRELLATDHVILNHSQVTWTTSQLAPLSPNYHTTPT
ncbi:hypothetical protein TNCV_2237861 [Trichonephila clavipes]|nr:hypothetical protein TNCV_2237861 [Trichonephila clavipes]